MMNTATKHLTSSVGALYGAGDNVGNFLDKHIEVLKLDSNERIRATGNVLDSAKSGFGIGYITSVVIISAGQIILGNPLSAAKTVVTGALLINPVAMTCAAVGAIAYGWSALSDAEQGAIIERIKQGLELGAELVKSIIHFVSHTLSALLSADLLAEFKSQIAEVAQGFGRSLSDVTRSLTDRLSDTTEAVVVAVEKSTERAVENAAQVAHTLKRNLNDAVTAVSESADAAGQYIRQSLPRK